MRVMILAAAASAMLFSACASKPAAPAGMKAGQFVAFECEGGKRFQARLAEGGGSVRLRYEGGYELDNKGAGVYEAEGWKLAPQGTGTVELSHNGKSTLKNCKAA